MVQELLYTEPRHCDRVTMPTRYYHDLVFGNVQVVLYILQLNQSLCSSFSHELCWSWSCNIIWISTFPLWRPVPCVPDKVVNVISLVVDARVRSASASPNSHDIVVAENQAAEKHVTDAVAFFLITTSFLPNYPQGLTHARVWAILIDKKSLESFSVHF